MKTPMNRPVTGAAIVNHECSCCGHEIPVNYDKILPNRRVNCPHCNALFGIDADAEFVDGIWRDRTKLWRV